MANADLFDPTLIKREIDPRFGEIKGVKVGTLFDNRKACAAKGVHSKPMAGISGTVKEGAFSIVLASGYKDDKDEGETFIYTGTGGQEDSFSGGGPQVEDQTFDHPDNAALKKSVETKRPVRVIRGPNRDSKYAPAKGYRYDGLYIVEDAYMGKSKDGYQICQYHLRRLPDLPPLPLNPDYRGSD
ncbi:SRA-YDG [Pholiota conissans]|uniref:SRA-YDG n=1 Tax=Pholiota conissans TaxID=109636 RepID=A0A9P5ZBX5_9AGAR|nr:SRA-YDG [Pholiota conissans]